MRWQICNEKVILGFECDGINKTLWLEEAKRAYLLTVLHGWIRSSKAGMIGIPFKEFESVIAKVRHAFTAIPAGRGPRLVIPAEILRISAFSAPVALFSQES